MLCIGRGVRGTAQKKLIRFIMPLSRKCESVVVAHRCSRPDVQNRAFSAKLSYRLHDLDILNPTWEATNRADTRTLTCYSGSCDMLPPYRRFAAGACIH